MLPGTVDHRALGHLTLWLESTRPRPVARTRYGVWYELHSLREEAVQLCLLVACGRLASGKQLQMKYILVYIIYTRYIYILGVASARVAALSVLFMSCQNRANQFAVHGQRSDFRMAHRHCCTGQFSWHIRTVLTNPNSSHDLLRLADGIMLTATVPVFDKAHVSTWLGTTVLHQTTGFNDQMRRRR